MMLGGQVSVTADRPRFGWLPAARVAWVAVAAITAAICLLAIPLRYDELAHPAPAVLAALDHVGLSARAYALYSVVLDTAFVAVFLAVGGIIFWRRSHEPIALLVAFMLVAWGPNNGLVIETPDALQRAYPTLDPLILVGIAGYLSWMLFFYLFPSGRFVPGWTRWTALAWLFTATTWALPFGVESLPAPLFGVVILALWGSFVVSQVYRYRSVSSSLERQQTKWVVFGIAVAIGGFLGTAVAVGAPIDLAPEQVGRRMLGQALVQGFMLLIPLSLGVAVLRRRLWEIDPVINRTLVYGALTAAAVGLYVFVVGYLGALFRTGDNLAISLVATGLVAVLFQPVRATLQRGANRLLYGERDEPYAVIARLGRRLEGTLAPDAILPTVVETVAGALKLPYTAIALGDGAGRSIAAATGTPTPDPLRLPLTYQGEPVGELLLAPRARDEGFSPADRRLLHDLARQAGVAARAVRLAEEARALAADLQASRERLVTAREEERRRLRRDLHDGLGPRLAALTLRLDTARDLLADDPRADVLLSDLAARTEEAVADIRRLVYALRPPALDDLGLVGALRQVAEGYGAAAPVVAIEAPASMPPLPAAVEVAAYRIAQEALTNVVKHARASQCTVRLEVDAASTALIVTVEDDGRGVPPDRVSGIGLTSIRERADELGGTCAVEPLPGGGTRVRAVVPCRVASGAAEGD